MEFLKKFKKDQISPTESPQQPPRFSQGQIEFNRTN
uniref:Uncharacterized protein n=1 Tax=Anguilla anguilla TaxID=7936 RepID=A0A0E9TB65_ANGAN